MNIKSSNPKHNPLIRRRRNRLPETTLCKVWKQTPAGPIAVKERHATYTDCAGLTMRGIKEKFRTLR